MPEKSISIEDCRNYIETFLFGPVIDRNNQSNNESECVGVELECFPYTFDTEQNVRPVRLYGNSESLLDKLIPAAESRGGIPRYPEKGISHGQHVHVTAIDFDDGSSFQFEPGGQVEISTAPCYSIRLVSEKINSLQLILHHVKEKANIHCVQSGINPWFDVDAIGMQMAKIRYSAMSRYFDSLNKFGRQMMLQTCSLQVNMDTGKDWDTRCKRFIAANLLAPFATAIFSNSPVTAGKVNGYKCHRSYVWQHLDPSRTGLLDMDQLALSFSREKIVDAYLGFALKAPVIYMEDFGDEIFPLNITLEHWILHPIRGLAPTLTHLKNHCSLLFPEVRLKGYLELRSVDAPPPEWQMIPVLFYSGLLYSGIGLDKTLDLLLPLSPKLPLLMKHAAFGLEHDEIFKTAKELMALTIEGLSTLPGSFIDENFIRQTISFFENFTMQRKTFADDELQKIQDKKMYWGNNN